MVQREFLCVVVLAAALCVSPASVEAQGLCQPTETIARCWLRLRTQLGPPADKLAMTEAAKTEQKQAPKKTETSLEQVNGLSSSVKDFLPLLQLGGVLGAVQKDDQTGLVTVALNTPFLGSSGVDKKDNALQLKAVIDSTAKLFEPLRKKLPEKDRDTLEKQILAGQDDAENMTVHGSYNVSSRRLGRNFNQHKDTLDALFDQAVSTLSSPRDTFTTKVAALAAALPNVSFNDTPWSSILDADKRVVEDMLVGIIEAEQKFAQAFGTALKDSGLDVYGQLVTNQPQLQFTVSKSFRNDFFGPDLLSGRISFEMGLDNSLNDALGSYNGTCAANAAQCLKTYAAFLKNPGKKAAVKAGSRVSMYLEFVKNDAYHFSSVEPALDLAIAEGTGWSAGFDYGRLIAVDDAGTAAGRFDASFKWEAPADKTIDRRFVASLTLTKKFGDLSIPFGLVYANKPKYLTGIDQGLTANIGLKFNLFSQLQ